MIYADILPDYRKTLNDIDAMLRELEELKSRIEVLLGLEIFPSF
ncbi:hypothetical protein [Infirmifilum uzonense]|nr:hypothetical protein [Infirmifilum uzonense]